MIFHLSKRLLVCMAVMLLFAGWSMPVFALGIYSPIGAGTNDFLQGSNFAPTIDQSGLSTGFNNGDDFDAYIGGATHVATLNGGAGFGSGLPGSIVFDLGVVLSISRFAMWGANGPFSGFSISEFTLFGSLDDSFTDDEIFYSDRADPPMEDPGGRILAQIFDGWVPVDAQFIQLQVDSNIAGPTANQTIIFGEVAFGGDDTAAPVPEPATILLLGTGFAGLLGFGRRKFSANS